MDEGNSTQSIADVRPPVNGGQLVGGNKPKISYLERLANGLGEQRQLINLLEDKLHVVSDRNPSTGKDVQPNEPRVHIASVVSLVNENNRDLARLLEELAL